MRYSRRFLLFGATLLVGAVFVPVVAWAQTEEVQLNKRQVERISQNCVAAQVQLEQVQHSDIAVRINRGQAYDNMLTRLMAPFNAQAALDRLDTASELTEVTSDFEEEFSAFKQEYAVYERRLLGARRIPCQDQPERFYELVLEVRKLRAGLQERVKTMQQLSEDYLALVDDVVDELEETEEESS